MIKSFYPEKGLAHVLHLKGCIVIRNSRIKAFVVPAVLQILKPVFSQKLRNLCRKLGFAKTGFELLATFSFFLFHSLAANRDQDGFKKRVSLTIHS